MPTAPSPSEVPRQNGSLAFRGKYELRDGGVNSLRKLGIQRLSKPEDNTTHDKVTSLLLKPCSSCNKTA